MHRWTGGDMATWMSPLDPIFWLHHANVDRLWSQWNQRFANTANTTWLNHVFSDNFVRPNGSNVSPVVKELLDTRTLGYRYDTDPSDDTTAARIDSTVKLLGAVSNTASAALGQALSVPIDGGIPADLATALRRSPGAVTNNALRIRIEGLSDATAGATRIRVFLNCAYLSPETPIEDPHYVGTVAFFPHGPGHGSEPTTFVLDGSRTIQRLSRLGRPEATAPIQVQLIATGPSVGPTVAMPRISPSRVEVALVASRGVV
jgi:hypothetical protein